MFLFCFIFYDATTNTNSLNNIMVINKKECKIQKLFIKQITFFVKICCITFCWKSFNKGQNTFCCVDNFITSN